MISVVLCAAVVSLVIPACKSDRKDNMSAAETPDAPKRYAVTPFGKSEAFADAALSDMKYENGRFTFQVTGSKYKLGEQTPDASSKMCANSAEGQHIHLIVNNKPYSAHYVSSFEHAIPDGTHHLLAFLSRSYHESIKAPKAHIARKVRVENGSIVESSEITDPMLFFSRPKGTYVGADTKKVMLDFYPLNVDLKKDYKVKLHVNGEVTMLDEWQPYYIENLPFGQNSIGIALVYNDGSPVPGLHTSTLQVITLAEDPLPL